MLVENRAGSEISQPRAQARVGKNPRKIQKPLQNLQPQASINSRGGPMDLVKSKGERDK
jgi:hypothetical protein